MKYRAEIDGLRALAVIPVILFHAGFELFSGGFIGVDIFFVISGYLITKIIYQQSLIDNFSFITFYDRRIRRILPPLILTALLTIIITMSFTPSDIKNVGQSLVATFTFLSNYFFYLETDYFNPFNQAAPLLHTWSLSVEEQYYIFAPLLIYVIAKRRLFKYFIVIIILMASYNAAVSLTNTNPNLSFYSLHTRTWELLAGTLIAFLCTDYSQLKLHSLLSDIISILSLLTLILCFVTINENFSHPSYVTVIPVVSTAFIIYFSKMAPITRGLLSNRILVGIGLISYSLYLFHNPIFSAIQYHFDEYSLVLKVLSLPFIVSLSVLSYKYIEKPLRRSSWNRKKSLHVLIAISMTSLLILGYVAHTKNGFLSYFKRNFHGDANLIVNIELEQKLILRERRNYYPSDVGFGCKDKKCQRILIIGDSFAEDAYLALRSLGNTKHSIRRINLDDECMNGYISNASAQICGNNIVDMSLLNDADIVVITAKWQESTYRDGFILAENIVNDTTATVFLVGSILFEDLSSFAFKLSGISNDLRLISELAFVNQRFDRLHISNKLRALAKNNTAIKWIEKSDFFCEMDLQRCTLYDEDFNPLILDNSHLTTRAYIPFGDFLITNIENLTLTDE